MLQLGHALAYRAFGLRARIWLNAWGGQTWAPGATQLGLARLAVVQAAGPLGALAVGLALAAGPAPRLGALCLDWALLSALPLYPLAGGRLLETALWARLGPRATVLAQTVAIFVGLGLAGWGGAQHRIHVLALGLIAAAANLSALLQARRETIEAPLAARIDAALMQLSADRDSEAGLAVAREVLGVARAPSVRGRAGELKAWAFLMSGRLDAAEQALALLLAGHAADPFLVASLALERRQDAHALALFEEVLADRPSDLVGSHVAHARVRLGRLDAALPLAEASWAGPSTFEQLMAPLFQAQRYAECARVGERWFAQAPSGTVAFNTACALVHLGRLDEAVAWLERALTAGFRDLRGLDEDPDLAPLRARPDFHALRARLTSAGRIVG